MKNTLLDLNNHLFAELERLGDESLDEEKLYVEIERAKAITGIATQAVNNANLVFKSYKYQDERMNIDENIPKMLNGDKND